MKDKIVKFCFAIFSLLSSFNISANVLNGVLIEGTDYTGKTSIAKELYKKIKNKRKCALSHVYISDNQIVAFLHEQGKFSRSIKIASKLYAAAYIIDLNNFQPNKDIFYIQDRNWLSMQCRLNFLHQDEEILPNTVFLNNINFKYKFYLNASKKVRLSRAKNRAKQNVLNKHIINNSDYLMEYDSYCKKIIKNDDSWIYINTDEKTVNDVAEEIISYIA